MIDSQRRGRRLVRATATNALVTYYTSPTDRRTWVWDVLLCNKTGGAVALTLYFGGFVVLSAYSLAAGETFQVTMAQVLESGETIQAQAGSNNAIDMHITGGEATSA